MKKARLFIGLLLFFALAACARYEIEFTNASKVNCPEIIGFKHYETRIAGIPIYRTLYVNLEDGQEIKFDPEKVIGWTNKSG